MKRRLMMTASVLAALAVPLAVQAQGVVRGAEEGAAAGNRAAGPVGGAVGAGVARDREADPARRALVAAANLSPECALKRPRPLARSVQFESESGTNRTNRADLLVSVDQGRPEVIGTSSTLARGESHPDQRSTAEQHVDADQKSNRPFCRSWKPGYDEAREYQIHNPGHEQPAPPLR